MSALPHGTPAWFDMVGSILVEAARAARLPPDLDVVLVERYTDGVELRPGVVQGLRLDIRGGVPAFRPGALPGETGDVTIEVATAAARALNLVTSTDPAWPGLVAAMLDSGALRIAGDPARLGDWFAGVHDRIVARTR